MTEATDHEARQSAALAMQLINTHLEDCATYRRENRITLRWIVGLIITGLLMLIAQIVGGYVKAAHSETVQEWIHRTTPSCCDHRDCVPVNARKTAAGWVVEWHGEMMPYNGQIGQSPGETTACGTPERIRCLFLSGGTS